MNKVENHCNRRTIFEWKTTRTTLISLPGQSFGSEHRLATLPGCSQARAWGYAA